MEGPREDGGEATQECLGDLYIWPKDYMDISNFMSAELGNSMNMVTSMGMSMANQFPSIQEPFFQINSNREWNNANIYGIHLS